MTQRGEAASKIKSILAANEHEWAWVGHFPEIVAGFEDFRG
jgi:hypothetical protein